MRFQASLLAAALASFSAFGQNPTQPPVSSSPVTAVDAQRPGAASAANSSAQISEVVKLSDAGVGEKAILSYVANSAPVSLTAEDVIGLHQRGVSLTVITAMLQPTRMPAADTPTVPPPPTMATIAFTTTGPNPPIIYPTPAREAVPLTSPEAIYYSPYGYGVSSVIITGSSYYPRGTVSGAYCGFGAIQTYGAGGFYRYGARNYGCASPSYGCASASRCRF